MNYLVYGPHLKEITYILQQNFNYKINYTTPGGHLKFCGISMLEHYLNEYRPSVLLFCYATKQNLQMLEYYEMFDVVLDLCRHYKVIPIFIQPIELNGDYKPYITSVNNYCRDHHICVIDSSKMKKDNDKEVSVSNITNFIYSSVNDYITKKKFTAIDYNTPLAEGVNNTLSVDKLQVNYSLSITGKGHINGFEVEVEEPLIFDQIFYNKERLDIKLGKTQIFLPGGTLNIKFNTFLKSGNFFLKKIFYKGHIERVVIDNKEITLDQKYENNNFFSKNLKTVHTKSNNTLNVKRWATHVLDQCENCELSKLKTKNVIVIFSSTDRSFLTETKKQYLYKLASTWNSELIIITNPRDVLTKKQYDIAVSFKSRRKNILNYVCKIVVVYNLLEKYDKVMWLDDTNVISPFAPNLFNVVPENKIGALVVPRDCGFGDAIHDYKYLIKHRETAIRDRYYNTGVMVIPKVYRDIFSFESVLKDCNLFQSPYPTQCWQNYLMEIHNCEIFDISCMYNLMPCVYHYASAYNETIDISNLYTDLLKYHIVHFTGFYKHRELLHNSFLQYSESIFDQKITIVIMNFKRSLNIKDYILPYYDNIHAIDEVIVVHCLESTVFKYKSQKVKHVYEFDTDTEYGVFTRYIAAKKYAKNKCILFTDDDVIIPAKTMSMVYQKWKENPNRIVGAEGRRVYFNIETQLYEYKSVMYHGDVDFLLTSCCMSSYDNIVNVCNKEHIMSDYKNTTVVKWNGEDMYLCLTSSILHNIMCYSVDSPLVALDQLAHVISRITTHVEERSRFLNLFFKRYKTLESFKPIILELVN